MNGDGFIDTEDHSGEVEQEEHDDGGNKNNRMVDIIVLITLSHPLWFSTFRTICLVSEKNGRTLFQSEAGKELCSSVNFHIWVIYIFLSA